MTFPTHRIFFVTRMATAACGILIGIGARGPDPEYFPLEVGNTWLYKATTIVGTQPLQLSTTYQTMRVTGMERIGDQYYFDVSYFGRDVLLQSRTSWTPRFGWIFRYTAAIGSLCRLSNRGTCARVVRAPWSRCCLSIPAQIVSPIQRTMAPASR